MDHITHGQVSTNAALVYDEFFVPALFAEWPKRVVDAAHLQPGDRILDVACGTGIVAREAAERVGPQGMVIGLDINDGMLAVAAQKAPDIEWRQGRAESLPFETHTFDAVLSQFGLMFFEDQAGAIREMMRVLLPGGRLVVAVWASLDQTPGYAAMADLLERLFGKVVANSLHAPYALGNEQELQVLFRESGVQDIQLETHRGMARFPSLDAWIDTEIKGWVLVDVLNDDQIELLLREARDSLMSFVTPEGTVVFPAPAHIVSAVKR